MGHGVDIGAEIIVLLVDCWVISSFYNVKRKDVVLSNSPTKVSEWGFGSVWAPGLHTLHICFKSQNYNTFYRLPGWDLMPANSNSIMTIEWNFILEYFHYSELGFSIAYERQIIVFSIQWIFRKSVCTIKSSFVSIVLAFLTFRLNGIYSRHWHMRQARLVLQ